MEDNQLPDTPEENHVTETGDGQSPSMQQDQSAAINTSAILTSDIQNMEVHHHPEVEKKGLKEYFLEGLMIFIAVMLGFFAESLREMISEKRIEKEFIESFVADLKKDTATFNVIIPIEETFVDGLDTMLHTLSHPPYTDSSLRLMYYLSRKYTESIEQMPYTLRTITQLKYSGGLRLISDKKASDSIVLYNKNVDDVVALLNYTTHDLMIPSIHAGNRVLNVKYLLPYNGETVINLLKSGEKMSLLTSDEKEIATYTALIYEVRQIRQSYVRQLKRHQSMAINMIKFFQQEYHLANE
jgi:hypothetical protein